MSRVRVPDLDRPDGFVASTSWERVRDEATAVDRLNRAEWFVRSGERDGRPVVVTVVVEDHRVEVYGDGRVVVRRNGTTDEASSRALEPRGRHRDRNHAGRLIRAT